MTCSLWLAENGAARGWLHETHVVAVGRCIVWHRVQRHVRVSTARASREGGGLLPMPISAPPRSTGSLGPGRPIARAAKALSDGFPILVSRSEGTWRGGGLEIIVVCGLALLPCVLHARISFSSTLRARDTPRCAECSRAARACCLRIASEYSSCETNSSPGLEATRGARAKLSAAFIATALSAF